MKCDVNVFVKNLGAKSMIAIALLVFGMISASAVAQDCHIGSFLVNSCGPWIGTAANNYPQAPSDMESQIIYHEQRVGRQMGIVHAYNSVGENTLSTDELYFINRSNTHLLLNWKPASKWADASGGNASVNAGIDQMANSILGVAPKKVMLSVFHEPQNDVSANNSGLNCALSGSGTAGTEADYVNMWHNVRSRFDALGVTNVVWVMIYQGDSKYNCMTNALWPGNSYVTWVAWDQYDSGAGWNSDISSFYNNLVSMTDASHNYTAKPWMLAEFGIHGARPQSEAYQYYVDAKTAVDNNTFPNIKAYIVWDSTGAAFNQVGYTGPGPVSNPSNYFLDPTEQSDYNAFANDTKLQ